MRWLLCALAVSLRAVPSDAAPRRASRSTPAARRCYVADVRQRLQQHAQDGLRLARRIVPLGVGPQGGMSFDDDRDIALRRARSIRPRASPGDPACSEMIVRTTRRARTTRCRRAMPLSAPERCALIQWVAAAHRAGERVPMKVALALLACLIARRVRRRSPRIRSRSCRTRRPARTCHPQALRAVVGLDARVRVATTRCSSR